VFPPATDRHEAGRDREEIRMSTTDQTRTRDLSDGYPVLR
jgi:hypothetical protein